jgi:pilus assembly protein CpaB
LKRSNRLIMLIGFFLAVVAFVGVFYLLTNRTDTGREGGVLKTMTVFAAKDIPLGVTVTQDSVSQSELPNNERAQDAFTSTSLVIGQIARTNIVKGAQITAGMFSTTGGATLVYPTDGKRAISVQVDQVSGVGTLVRPGDYVDMLVGFTADKFPVVTVNPADDTIVPVAGLNATTVKLLLQGVQVLGTLLPAPTDTGTTDGETTPGEAPTNLNGQQEIVVLNVTPQQSEIIKFAQMDGNISLVLRNSKEFQDPNDPTIPVEPLPDETTGIILKILVDEYGVLVPQVVEALLPAQAAR